jgi:hypothetical protein
MGGTPVKVFWKDNSWEDYQEINVYFASVPRIGEIVKRGRWLYTVTDVHHTPLGDSVNYECRVYMEER